MVYAPRNVRATVVVKVRVQDVVQILIVALVIVAVSRVRAVVVTDNAVHQATAVKVYVVLPVKTVSVGFVAKRMRFVVISVVAKEPAVTACAVQRDNSVVGATLDVLRSPIVIVLHKQKVYSGVQILKVSKETLQEEIFFPYYTSDMI